MSEHDVIFRVWSLETLECVRVLGGHTDPVSALVVGDNTLVAGSGDTVRLYNLDDLCVGRWGLILLGTKLTCCSHCYSTCG
jgi:hypothetical protein